MDVTELRKQLEQMQTEMEQLDAVEDEHCISNPPYQISTGGSAVTNIFHLFQETAMKFWPHTTMIYPAGWISRSRKGTTSLYDKMFAQDSGLKSIDYYSYERTRVELFPQTQIKDGISIVSWSKEHNSQGTHLYNEQEIPHWSLENNRYFVDDAMLASVILTKINPIIDELESISVWKNGKKPSKHTGEWHGLWESKTVAPRIIYTQLTRGLHCENDIQTWFQDRSTAYYLVSEYPNPPAELKTPVQLFTNHQPGSAGRATLYWIEQSELKNSKLVGDNTYFVITMSGLQGNETKYDFEVIGPNVGYGRSRFAIAVFSTSKEAENCKNTMDTDFMQALCRSTKMGRLTTFGAYVPMLDYSKQAYTNEDLMRMFNLTDAEYNILLGQEPDEQ
jgi:hypothetical protein